MPDIIRWCFSSQVFQGHKIYENVEVPGDQLSGVALTICPRNKQLKETITTILWLLVTDVEIDAD